MDWIINDELGLTVGDIFGYTAATAMVIGGIVPYIPQYKQIKRTQDAEGFSLHVCLALLVANSLRILFWFSKRYELPLLIQSIVMNLTMFLMIHLCVKVKRHNAIMQTRERVFAGEDEARSSGSVGSGGGGACGSHGVDSGTGGNISGSGSGSIKSREERGIVLEDNLPTPSSSSLKRGQSKHYLSDFDLRYFWTWTDFQSYLDFMLVFWIIGAGITYIMLSIDWFMETVGFLAVFTEAMLGAPQFLRNFNNKSTHGMSLHMVIMWTCGDLFKTFYFVVRHAPIQFWICGTLQVSLDIAILLQVYIYRRNPGLKNVHRGD